MNTLPTPTESATDHVDTHEATGNGDAPFPIDWDDWRGQWKLWLARHLEAGTVRRSSYRYPAPNFFADEVLGSFRIADRNVELSEVTFPALDGTRETRRYVGVTYGQASGLESGGIHETFAELEAELGL